MATTSFLASTGGNLMKAARTIREEARRERLLNAKTRTIGVRCLGASSMREIIRISLSLGP